MIGSVLIWFAGRTEEKSRKSKDTTNLGEASAAPF